MLGSWALGSLYCRLCCIGGELTIPLLLHFDNDKAMVPVTLLSCLDHNTVVDDVALDHGKVEVP